jgi:Tol biopolymer transport system component
MTSPRRFEQDLPALLADLYLAGTPDYRDDLVQRLDRVRQRPAWTFLERWLPVEIVTSRAPVARVPWRQLGVLAIIAILLATMLAVYIGSQQPRLPAPFGVAGNGLVAYSKDGDIHTVDPVTGIATAVVTGPEIDVDPEFSRDGSMLVFGRQASTTPTTYDLVVSRADGSGQRVIAIDPKLTMDDMVQFTPDGRSLLVSTKGGQVDRYDVAGTTPPVAIGHGRFMIGEVRPPDGAQLLLEPDSTSEIDLWIMNADGTGGRPLYRPPFQSEHDLAQVSWSPDGQHIAFTCSTETDVAGSHICVMDADGGNVRVVGDTGSDWFETDLSWSPDSGSIAFNRWRLAPGGAEHLVQPIGIVSVDGGPVRSVGAAPASEGALFAWSPDGTSLLSIPARLMGSPVGAVPARPVAIDVATAEQREMPFEVTSNLSWQRVAP